MERDVLVAEELGFMTTVSRWGWRVGIALSLILISWAVHLGLPARQLISIPVHAAVEAFGVMTVWLVAVMILLSDDASTRPLHRWIGYSMIAMGSLDLFHAGMEPGQLFVWFRSMATLFGGLLALGVWLPERGGAGSAPVWQMAATLLVSVVFALVSLLHASRLPVMVADSGFTAIAVLINAVGGIAFLGAALRLATPDVESGLLSTYCIMLGVAGLVFGTPIWGLDWWLWHFLRLAACVLVSTFLFVRYRSLVFRLREAVSSRDTFISLASHELKTPLTPLLLGLQLMRRDTLAARPLSVEAIDRAIRSVRQLTRLAGDLLDACRVGVRHLEMERSVLSLNAVARSAVETARVAYPQRQFPYTEADLFNVAGDAGRLEQVLAILLDNAVKYSPDGGAVRVGLVRREAQVEVSVSDVGVGIPAGDLRRVFQRFFRAGNISEQQFRGLGLGLFIAGEIVRQHGGRIEAQSQLGQGTTFTVVLPVCEAAGELPTDPGASPDPAT